jgi:predicted GNAT family acetyltransferase
MKEIKYHLATEKDIPILINIRIDFIAEHVGKMDIEAAAELRKELQKYFAVALNNRTYICWLAEINGEIAGSGGMSIRLQPGNFKNPSGRMAYIMSMYTLPPYRLKGICTEILKRLSESAANMGITVLELHATPSGEPLYVKDGFIRHKEPTYRKFI